MPVISYSAADAILLPTLTSHAVQAVYTDLAYRCSFMSIHSNFIMGLWNQSHVALISKICSFHADNVWHAGEFWPILGAVDIADTPS